MHKDAQSTYNKLSGTMIKLKQNKDNNLIVKMQTSFFVWENNKALGNVSLLAFIIFDTYLAIW